MLTHTEEATHAASFNSESVIALLQQTKQSGQRKIKAGERM